jgi:hypothetical protein
MRSGVLPERIKYWKSYIKFAGLLTVPVQIARPMGIPQTLIEHRQNQAILRLLANRDTNLIENDSPDRLMECGSVPMISGWSHAMWVPSQIMRADVWPQSQLIWARIRDDLAPKP